MYKMCSNEDYKSEQSTKIFLSAYKHKEYMIKKEFVLIRNVKSACISFVTKEWKDK